MQMCFLEPSDRIFYIEDEGFIVITGDCTWSYPESRDLIIEEFHLPETTVIKKDVHGNIWHGWSYKFM